MKPVVEITLVYSGAFALLTAAVYTLVGTKVGRPGLEHDELFAIRMFRTWWFGLAGITYVTSIEDFSAAFGYTSLAVYEALFQATLIVVCVALLGLAYYLAFLFTGSTKWFYPLAVFYAAFYLGLAYLVSLANPIGVRVEGWDTGLRYANEEVLGGTNTTILVILLLLPQLIGAFAYATLFFQAEERTAKYRVAVVSLTLLGWFGSSIVASVVGINDQAWWDVVSRAIGLTASLLILMAYRPPDWINRMLQGGPPGMAAP